jgi:transposase
MPRAKNDKERKAILNQIDDVYKANENMTIKEACAAIGISDETYYNWRNKLKEGNTAAVPKRAPASDPNTAISLDIEQKVVDLKKAKPFLGLTKISKQLNYTYGIKLSSGKVKKILTKHGLVKTDYPVPKKQHQPRRFERLSRNEMWMMDIMYYRLKKEGRFYLIFSTITVGLSPPMVYLKDRPLIMSLMFSTRLLRRREHQ